jgi:hypothetical protein
VAFAGLPCTYTGIALNIQHKAKLLCFSLLLLLLLRGGVYTPCGTYHSRSLPLQFLAVAAAVLGAAGDL